MLILGMPLQVRHGRLEDVGRGRVAQRNPPAAAALVEVERRLRLRTSETELTLIADSPGRGTILAQIAKAVANLRVGEQLDVLAAGNLVAMRKELDGTGAVAADILQQGKRISGGDLEPLRPSGEGLLVIRQQPPEECRDDLAL